MRRTFSEWFFSESIPPYELKWKKDIECYDKIMESHPNYLNIFYTLALVSKQRLKKIIIYLAKVKGDS